MKLILQFIFYAFVFVAPVNHAAEADTPVGTITEFYKTYLAYNYQNTPNIPRPEIGLSVDFSSVVNNTESACKKFADYPCGWGADGDEYLDTQESDPDLSYQNSGIAISEISPMVVRVKLNVYPSIKDAGNYYLKEITYKMLKESGKWVVDDVMYHDNKSTKQILIEEAKEAARQYNEDRASLNP